MRRGVVARLDRRHGLERRRELERLALFDDDVLDVGRVDRLDAALAQRLVDRARNQAVRDVVEDLVAKALAHDLGRHLAGPEAGNPRRLAVVARDLVDLGIHDVAVDLDDEVLLGVGDVYEFGFHVLLGDVAAIQLGTCAFRIQADGQVRRGSTFALRATVDALLRGPARSSQPSATCSRACTPKLAHEYRRAKECERGESNPHSLSATGS